MKRSVASDDSLNVLTREVIQFLETRGVSIFKCEGSIGYFSTKPFQNITTGQFVMTKSIRPIENVITDLCLPHRFAITEKIARKIAKNLVNICPSRPIDVVSRPFVAGAINWEDGSFSERTGELHAFSEDNASSSLIPHKFPDKSLIKPYVQDVFEILTELFSHEDVLKLIATMRDTLFGKATSNCVILAGGPESGKSIFTHLVLTAFGQKLCGLETGLSMTGKEKKKLVGKKFSVCVYTPKKNLVKIDKDNSFFISAGCTALFCTDAYDIVNGKWKPKNSTIFKLPHEIGRNIGEPLWERANSEKHGEAFAYMVCAGTHVFKTD